MICARKRYLCTMFIAAWACCPESWWDIPGIKAVADNITEFEKCGISSLDRSGSSTASFPCRLLLMSTCALVMSVIACISSNGMASTSEKLSEFSWFPKDTASLVQAIHMDCQELQQNHAGGRDNSIVITYPSSIHILTLKSSSRSFSAGNVRNRLLISISLLCIYCSLQKT